MKQMNVGTLTLRGYRYTIIYYTSHIRKKSSW